MVTLTNFCAPERATPRRRRTRIAGCLIALASTCAHAHQEQQDPFSGFVDTLKKSAADALKSQIDKSLSPTANSPDTPPAPQPTDLNNATPAPQARKAASGGPGASGGSGRSGYSGSSGGSGSSGRSGGSGGSRGSGGSGGAVGSGGPTSDEVEKEVSDFSSACTKNSFFSSLHDCGCMTSSYRREVLASGSTKIRATLENKLLATCPAPKETIYNWVMTNCESYFQHTRSDHAQFCGCSAEKFSVEFHAQPLPGLRLIEALRKRSELACGLADRSHNIH